MKSLYLSALWALLVVSLLSSGAYSFYVITNSDCPGCEDRLRAVKANFPGSSFVEYELTLNETRTKFNEINTIIGEAYLPMPLIGVFREDELIAVVGGGQSAEDWETILNSTNEGVPLYVENSVRRAEYIKTIADPESVPRRWFRAQARASVVFPVEASPYTRETSPKRNPPPRTSSRGMQPVGRRRSIANPVLIVFHLNISRLQRLSVPSHTRSPCSAMSTSTASLNTAVAAPGAAKRLGCR